MDAASRIKRKVAMQHSRARRVAGVSPRSSFHSVIILFPYVPSFGIVYTFAAVGLNWPCTAQALTMRQSLSTKSPKSSTFQLLHVNSSRNQLPGPPCTSTAIDTQSRNYGFRVQSVRKLWQMNNCSSISWWYSSKDQLLFGAESKRGF